MPKKSSILSLSLACAMMLISACKIQKGPKGVANFDLNKYLGTWYEAARIDTEFEKGCENVTATYSVRDKGGVNVLNKCIRNGKQKEAKGRAFFRGASDVGELKVTFFWPFYGQYNVLYVDEDYKHAIVGGSSEKYFWILSREKNVDEVVLKKLVKKGKKLGFPTEKLVYTKHD